MTGRTMIAFVSADVGGKPCVARTHAHAPQRWQEFCLLCIDIGVFMQPEIEAMQCKAAKVVCTSDLL
eukprot:164807-Pelagomonas_calceolata.AAC.1